MPIKEEKSDMLVLTIHNLSKNQSHVDPFVDIGSFCFISIRGSEADQMLRDTTI